MGRLREEIAYVQTPGGWEGGPSLARSSHEAAVGAAACHQASSDTLVFVVLVHWTLRAAPGCVSGTRCFVSAAALQGANGGSC